MTPNGLMVDNFHKIVTNDSCIAVITNPQFTKFLLLREYRPALGGESFTLPGGGVEEGELPIDCLKRELREELGIDLPKCILISKTINNGSYHFGEDYVFLCILEGLESHSFRLENEYGMTSYIIASWEELKLSLYLDIKISGVLSALFLAKMHIDSLNK